MIMAVSTSCQYMKMACPIRQSVYALRLYFVPSSLVFRNMEKALGFINKQILIFLVFYNLENSRYWVRVYWRKSFKAGANNSMKNVPSIISGITAAFSCNVEY